MENLTNFIGCLHSEMECSHIINLAMEGLLNRLKRRLTENEKRMIKPGYSFVYLEEESGIIRWTDSKSWSPSRALGPFMMYVEKRSTNPLIKKIYTAKFMDKIVHIVIYNVYNHEERGVCCTIYSQIRKNIIPESYSKMARTHLNDKKKRNLCVIRKNIMSHNDDIFERYGRIINEEYNDLQYKNIYDHRGAFEKFINRRRELDMSFDNNNSDIDLSFGNENMCRRNFKKRNEESNETETNY
ncbi:cAMP-independent regulatory protein PAC2 (PAC2) [Vairimorpha necatrix]|uniref:cAMP-independent regulatory protein PAC2 (PAC2) n=1 Tax=Vairimorpha necatrix TaxID=6039 RepID=A0AAX4JB86_9MICR